MKTVIINGTVVDGTGRAGYAADVVVEGERIVDIVRRGGREGDGALATVQGTTHQPPNILTSQPPNISTPRVIDATGCLVTPGFIDAHAHSDAYLIIEPDAPSKISQGITTEINGQCGGSTAPRYGEARLSGDWAAILGDRLTWRSFGEYRAALEAVRPAVNTVQFVGHNTLRSSVVGYAGRAADDGEIEQMKYLLEEALEEGAFGLTTGLIYQPGKYATAEEVEELVRVAAVHGGYYATHIRSEGDAILEAIDEVLDLVRKTGVRAEISHLKTSGRRNWGKIDAVLEKVGLAVDMGLLLGSDRYPFCAAGTDLDVVFPDWAGEGAAKAECERLADPATRRRIVAEIDAQDRDWSTVMIGGGWTDETRAMSGKTVAQLMAARANATAGEIVCDILAKDGCKTGAFFFGMSEANLTKILAQPWIVPGSDASLRAPWGPLGLDHPHPRAYATMPEFYRLTRDIARMTSVPAERFGLEGRGVLRPGAYADIAVWKEDEFRMKANYARPHQFSTGVKMTMVNGTIPYLDGQFTGERGGRMLERT